MHKDRTLERDRGYYITSLNRRLGGMEKLRGCFWNPYKPGEVLVNRCLHSDIDRTTAGG